MLLRRTVTLLLLAVFAALPVVRAAQPLTYFLPEGTTYDSRVPTPEQFFGWQMGEWHVRSELLTAYLRAVAEAAPERVKFEIAGYSHERKPLVVLTITSRENHARLEQIRTQHLALLDPAKNASLDVRQMPVVINMGYSIHGNEPSGVNAVPLVVYYLAAAQGPKVDEALKNAVILMEVQRNPDGGDRAAQWFNQHKSLSSPSTDPADREHNEVWPRGRFNHYWFDPNRDWLPLVHPEAQVRAELFHRWRPNVLTDHHEMGTNSTFFFQPGVPTRNNPSSPKQVFELTHKIAAFHQRALDGKGVFYYSEQGFDDFYPGKGSTYPDLHGTIGILFEQGSSRGHAQESENGLVTFPFTIRNQVLTSFSTLEAALALRTELLTLQKNYPRDTAEFARASKVKAYVFGDDGDPARAWAFRDLLAKHRVEVRPLTEQVQIDGRTFAPGRAWVVLTEQAQFRLINEMFIRRTQFEDNVFYDVSAWTLPLAYNLPYAELERAPATGAVLAANDFPAGKLIGGHSDYAYLFNWNGYFAPRALQRLHQAGIFVKGLTNAPVQAVSADGTRATFQHGAVLVPVGMQPEKAARIREVIDTIVREDAVEVYGFTTGLTPQGVDFGSSSFVPLAPARVALLVGDGVDPHDIGAAWHVLDQRVGLAPTLLDLNQLGRANLGRYNVIVMADGRYESISAPAIDGLKRWVREGGTLVAMGRAAQWAGAKEIAPLEFGGRPAATDANATTGGRTRPTPPPEEAAAAGAGSAEPRRFAYGSASDREALRLVAGAIFAASIDKTHPLGYGFADSRLSLLRKNTLLLKPARSPYETPAVYTPKPLQAGFASEANQNAIANTAALVALPTGRGAVVAMTDDPNFRGFWYGGNRVFFNAVFYGRAIRPVRAGDDFEEDDDAHTH